MLVLSVTVLAQSPRVALTFDDGPLPGVTEALLGILKQANVKATFFVVGRSSVLRPDLVLQIARDGHELGNHSYSHLRLDGLTDRQVALELSATSELIARITGQKMKCFRPPGGRLSPVCEREMKMQDLCLVRWTLNAGDSEMDLVDLSRHHLLSLIDKIRPNAIVLLHNGSEQTLTDLAAFIQALKEKGFVFVTVSELSHD